MEIDLCNGKKGEKTHSVTGEDVGTKVSVGCGEDVSFGGGMKNSIVVRGAGDFYFSKTRAIYHSNFISLSDSEALKTYKLKDQSLNVPTGQSFKN